MAARNKPAGIRSLVYGIGKCKAVIEGLSVSGLDLCKQDPESSPLGGPDCNDFLTTTLLVNGKEP